MLTMILLTGDTKLSQQIELWVRQFMADKLRVTSFKSLADYKALLEQPVSGTAPLAAVAGEKAPAPALAPAPGAKDEMQIRLFCVDLELINQKPSLWVAELQRMTAEKGKRFLPDGITPKVLVMGFDGGAHKLESLQHDAIDDLLLKPVDRSLFLQKCEYLASDDPKLTPTFLFRAKASQIVEVGRDVVIDEISEFAVSVRSPGPVPEGSFAAIHAELFGAKGARRLIGRVYESVRHPVREGEYVVRFSYFGISPEQLSTIRRFIKANQTQVRTKTWGPPTTGLGGAGKDAAKPGLSKELQEKMALLKMRKFAIVDLNSETLAEAKSALETGFKGIVVRPFPSYTRLVADLRKLLPETARANVNAKPAPPVDPNAVIEPAFPGAKKLGFILRSKTNELVKFEPALKKSDVVFGKGAFEWLERADQFANAIERDDKDVFEEFMNLLEAGTPGKAHFRVTDANNRVIYIEATGMLEKAGATPGDGSALIRMDLQELDAETWTKALASAAGPATGKDISAFRFEAILIDGAFLRPNPATWYENFVALLRETKVLGAEDQPPKIFVLSDPKARARIEDFRIKGIADFGYKPLDRRFLIQKYQAFFPTLTPVREPEAPPFIPCELPAKLGKEVTMEEVSEFGLSIIHPTAFREKSFMRFFSRLFGEEGEWVSGRCHYCEKSGEGESMRCRFMFFGPHEELTQRIRRWIREDYVAKKDGKG